MHPRNKLFSGFSSVHPLSDLVLLTSMIRHALFEDNVEALL